jgi:hypothetical protein
VQACCTIQRRGGNTLPHAVATSKNEMNHNGA